jgi:hypothetical protein
MQAIVAFQSMLEKIPLQLATLSNTSYRATADDWSAKQELGHLLDSAVVNHGRLMRTLTEDNPVLPGYDGVLWVNAHDYQERDWFDLITTWTRLNLHFLMAVKNVEAGSWKRPCVIDGKPATLEFLFTDYVQHALHHLQHIGIDVKAFRTSTAAA